MNSIHVALAAFALLATRAQAEAPDPAALAAKRAELLAHCPEQPVLSAAEQDALPIHVTRWGDAGPRVLIIHGGVQGGLGGGPATFTGQEPLAARGWRLEVVDRPGFGSSPSRGPDDMMRDAGWLAPMLGKRAHLVGHSWGGAEALLAAARRPEAVASLTLIEPALELLLLVDPLLQQEPAARASLANRAAGLMSAQSSAQYGVFFARTLGAGADASAPNQASAAIEADPAKAAALGCALLAAQMAPPPVLKAALETVAKAGIPLLVVSGGWSPAYVAVGEAAARLGGGRHVIVPSHSHFVQLESAPAFNDVLDGHMREAERVR